MKLPIVKPIPTGMTAVETFRCLEQLPHVIFFDSASAVGPQARYSFVAADPFRWISRPADGSDALQELQSVLTGFHASHVPDLPPFQGGAAGMLSYDLALSLEDVPAAHIEDFAIPALAMGLYDVVVAFDHHSEQGWIISQGFPELDDQRRSERAARRIDEMLGWLNGRRVNATEDSLPRVRLNELAQQFRVDIDGVTSNVSPDGYMQMVQAAVEHIHNGDAFQVNLAQRLLCPARFDSRELYMRLRQSNPAPYSGYFDLGVWQICSTSPECFLKVRNGAVETRPIKGTRGRSTMAEADLFTGDDLQTSEKDRAENVMIVDLLRNDLSRVCEPESIYVSQLCEVETYAYVKHLVSVVCGQLRPDSDNVELLRACFPGGSITGAPKIRAMEIIAELEPTRRGAYCGSLAYLGFDGQMDSNILIRTVTAGEGWWQFPVGGGIVAQSDPEEEYRETWHKARGLLEALKNDSVD